MQSDNGPPFNSKEFETFAKEEGFDHHRVTPEHPRANGQVERFMQLLNKTEQIAHLQGKTGLHRNMAVSDMLMAYRDTPHPATGVTPYQAMRNRPIRTKLDHTVPRERSEQNELIDEKDQVYKEKMRRDSVNIKEHNFCVGVYVLLRQKKVNKWSTAYEPIFYIVIRISGSTITARRVTDGREITRDSSQFKLANALMHEEGAKRGDSEDCRETLLMNSGSPVQSKPFLNKVILLKRLLQTDHQGMPTNNWKSFLQFRQVLLPALLLPEYSHLGLDETDVDLLI